MKLTISGELYERLEEIAQQLGRDTEATALLAVSEFVENWRDYIRELDSIETAAEKRAILKTIAE